MAEKDFGLKREDHQKLTRAARMYSNLTGEDVNGIVSSIPVRSEEDDAAARAKAAEEDAQRKAEMNRKVEEAQQQARRLQSGQTGDVQPGNPGPGQPAMATERAKDAGHDRHGEEPDTAQPKK